MTSKVTRVEDGDPHRYRIVLERGRERRPCFEAFIPKDATEGELYAFFADLAEVLKRRRANETTRKERPPK